MPCVPEDDQCYSVPRHHYRDKTLFAEYKGSNILTSSNYRKRSGNNDLNSRKVRERFFVHFSGSEHISPQKWPISHIYLHYQKAEK